MRFDIRFVPGANEDLDHYEMHEQRIIVRAIATWLSVDAHVVSKRRKRLRSNPLAPWELRVGEFRVFYEALEEGVVRVLAVGHKEHNDLLIRGKQVAL